MIRKQSCLARRPRRLLTSRPLLLAVICVGCGGGTAIDDAPANQIGLARQALAGYGTGEWGGPVDYWDQNGYEVPVCYLHNPNNTGSEAGYFSEFIAANAEVEAVAGLDFFWDGPCSSVSSTALPSHITVIFDDQHGSRGMAGPGFQKRRTGDNFPGSFQIGIGVAANRFAFEHISVHELLHALGFLHEQQRPDSEATCPGALEDNGNNVIVTGADRLTPYDDESVMNYCRDDTSHGRLTHFDRVGLEVVYPKTFSRKLYGAFAFVTGNGLVSLPKGNLYPDWLRDGALESVIDGLVWGVGGTPVAIGPRFSLDGYGNSSFTLDGGMTDFMGRSHTIASTPLTISTAQHTAIAISFL